MSAEPFITQWNHMSTAPKDGEPVLLCIQWEDEPVLARWLDIILPCGMWIVCKENLRIDGDATIEEGFDQGDIIGWLPVPAPLWRTRAEQ